MKCPTHGIQLKKTMHGLSYYCPRCEFRTYDPKKFWLPDMRHSFEIPSAFAWLEWTLTNLTTDVNGNLVLSSGQTTGTAVSPQMINLTRKSTRYWDCTKVKLAWTHTSQKTGDIKYHASNNSGIGYRIIKTQNANFELNRGQELPQYRQSKYDDLRIKIELSRSTVGDTSPNVEKLVVTHNKVKL